MGISIFHKATCELCSKPAEFWVPTGKTAEEALPDGWGLFSSPTEHRVRCDTTACVEQATVILEDERKARAAQRTSIKDKKKATEEA